MLTSAQYVALKSYILGDVNLAASVSAGDHVGIAEYMNAPASPDFWCWKSSMSRAEIYGAMNWTTYIGRTVGERDAFNAILIDGSINPSMDNIRQAFVDIFSGVAASAVNQRAALNAAAVRKAKRIEKLFAQGTGSTAVPALLVFEGSIEHSDVSTALQLP